VSFLTPAEYHDLVLERLEADVIFSLDPLYKQLPLPVRTIPREELDAMSTFSWAKTYWADQRTKHRRARYSSEVQAARSRGKRLTDEHKRRLKGGSAAFWEQYHAWKAEQGKGEWKRNCPSCDKVLSYANHDTLQKAIKNNATCRNCKGGWKLSEESYRRISEANRRRIHKKCEPGCSCRKHSPEVCEKRRLAALGKPRNISERGKALQDIARRRRLKGQLCLDIF
jgi:hypothetical protein